MQTDVGVGFFLCPFYEKAETPSLCRFQREAGEARTEVEVLKRQIPSFSADDQSHGTGLDAKKGDGISDLSLQRRLAAKEVAAGVAREAKEMAEVEASKLQAALDECKREV